MMGQITPMFIISLALAVSVLTILISISAYASLVFSGINSEISASSFAMRNTIIQAAQVPNYYGIWVEWQ